MQLTDFKVLSFDCYGTLIDWETGITLAVQSLLARTGKALGRDQVLETFARHEAAQESETPSMIYSELLSVVHTRMAKEWGLEPKAEESEAFGNSIRNWPAFADSPEALQYLKQHYKLVILSNVDRESFKASNVRLEVEFDYIFTAQDIGSYKPNPRNFEYLIQKLGQAGFQKHEILHTAESLFHDHLPRQTRQDSPLPGFTVVMHSKDLALHIVRKRCRNMISGSRAWQKWPKRIGLR